MTRTGKNVGRAALALGLISASSLLVGGLVHASVALADIGVPLPVTSPTVSTSSVPLPVTSPTDVTSPISSVTSAVPLPVSDPGSSPTPTPTPTSTSSGATTGSSGTTSTDSSSSGTSTVTTQSANTATGSGSTAAAPSTTNGGAARVVTPTGPRTGSAGAVATAPAAGTTHAHRSGSGAAPASGLPSPAVLKQIEAMPMDKFSLPALPALLAGAPLSTQALSPGEAPLVAGAASAGSRGAVPRLVASRSTPAQDGNAVGITLFACAAAAVAAGLARFRIGRPGT